MKLSGRTLAAGILLASIPATQVFAQEINVYREEIKQYQNRMDKIKTGETTRYNSELSQISSWIDESLILIGKKEVDQVKALSLKIGVYVDFVEASMARDVAMGEAMEAESKLKALKAPRDGCNGRIMRSSVKARRAHTARRTAQK